MERKPHPIVRIWHWLHIDFWLLSALLVLSAYGLVILYSASGGSETILKNRIIQVGVGFLIMLIMARFSPKFYAKTALYLYIAVIILLILVDFFGVTSKGAQRWLDLGLFRFQPSELAKLSIPLMVAFYLGLGRVPISLKQTLIAFIIVFVPTILILIQPDLGTSILVCLSGVFVIFLAGMSWRLIFIAIAGLGAFIPIFWMFLMKEYQKVRVRTLFDPESDPLGAGYHIIQSKIAIGSGGFLGKGWMQGTQSQLEFLPEPHTDFIFAVLAEEFGFQGIIVLLAIYLLIIIRGLYIAANATTTFGRTLAGSIILIFFIYVFVNIGMVCGILPVVGVPLPLISYGGTSFVTLMAGFGLLMSIYSHKK